LTAAILVVDERIHCSVNRPSDDASPQTLAHVILLSPRNTVSCARDLVALLLPRPALPRHFMEVNATRDAPETEAAATGQHEAFAGDELTDDFGDEDLSGVGPGADPERSVDG